MTGAEFTRLAKTHRLRGKILDAARLVLVEGASINQSARDAECTPGGVSRALERLRRSVCTECGRPKQPH